MTTQYATGPQVNYARKLMSQRVVDPVWLDQQFHGNDVLEEWTKREMSDFIEKLTALPWKPRVVVPSAAGFVAPVKAKVDSLSGVITHRKLITNRFGQSLLLIIRLRDDHIVKTFGTGQSLWPTEVGDEVLVSGTVKAHETYEGQDQTALTRVQLVVVNRSTDEPEAEETPREDLWSDVFKYGTPDGFANPVGEIGNPVFVANQPNDQRVTGDYRASEIDDLLGHFGG